MHEIFEMINEADKDAVLSVIKSCCKNKNITIDADRSGNIILHKKGSGRKKLIHIKYSSEDLYITDIDKTKAKYKSTVEFDKGAVADKEVFGSRGSIGIIRASGKDGDEQHIELWDENMAEKGEECHIKRNIFCKAKSLYGFNISSVILLKIICDAVLDEIECVNDIYFTVDFSGMMNEFLISSIDPDFVCELYCAKETDDFKASKGAGIVIKDGNAVIDRKTHRAAEERAAALNIPYQLFIGKQNSLLELYSLCGNGPEVCGICLPIKYLGSGCEVADKNDIKAVTELIKSIVQQ